MPSANRVSLRILVSLMFLVALVGLLTGGALAKLLSTSGEVERKDS